jgi:hypothetical protein
VKSRTRSASATSLPTHRRQADEEEIEPFSVYEIQRLLKVIRQRRNSARWAVLLALGLRQGEA